MLCHEKWGFAVDFVAPSFISLMCLMCKTLTKLGCWVRQIAICKLEVGLILGSKAAVPKEPPHPMARPYMRQKWGRAVVGKQAEPRTSTSPLAAMKLLLPVFHSFLPEYQGVTALHMKFTFGVGTECYFVVSELGHHMLSEVSTCGPDLVLPSGKCRSAASWWDGGSGKPWDEIPHLSHSPESQHGAHTHFFLVLNNLGLLLPDKLN